jgi:hypothetical protein
MISTPLDDQTANFKQKLNDQWWRLNNLYWIVNKAGVRVKFTPNWAQEQLYREMWYCNVILKARQLGMTTFIQLYMLDCCLFQKNISAGVIAHNRDDAEAFFSKKIKYAYDNLPEPIKAVLSAETNSARELSFSNGSSIRVGTSMRSGTLQYLHVSEFGKLCAKYPEKAEEVVTGSLNAVDAGQFVFIESTAEGAWGRFYDMCQTAMAFAGERSKLDYKFFFFPWWKNLEYSMDGEVHISEVLRQYFDKIEKSVGHLSAGAKAWYAAKSQTQKSKMKQEFPSTPEEAFEQITELAVYGKELGAVLAEGRYCTLPINPSKPVDLFFDLGKSAKSPTTSVWFMQDNNPWFDFVDYYQASLQVVGDYVRDIKGRGYNLGRWFLPHDAEQLDYDVKTFVDRLVAAGVKREDIVVCDRVAALEIGIDLMREKFPSCRFDSNRTSTGFSAVKAYRYDFDEKLGKIIAPIHDWASHPSDALRQFAQGYRPKNGMGDAWNSAGGQVRGRMAKIQTTDWMV